MAGAETMAELWRGGLLESVHHGHGVICSRVGIERAWGDPDRVIFPRSSSKMLQALPLVESGAADAAGLGPEQLALACASHQGAEIHTTRVTRWLSELGLTDAALLCGPQTPRDAPMRKALRAQGKPVCNMHNNCSGKHCGFLTLGAHLNAGPDYIDPAHPVQQAVRAAFEEITDLLSPGYGIDGCSAPNFATTLTGLARAMAVFADPTGQSATRRRAIERLRSAMKQHPDLVAGETRACTDLMRATPDQTVVKTGAEGVFVAILPDLGLGVALKIEDGTTRAAECAMAAILVQLGVADPSHPLVSKWMRPDQKNFAGRTVGFIQPGKALI